MSPTDPQQAHWGWRGRSIAEVLWPSFLVAAMATMIFFALFDPEGLLLALEYPLETSRTTVYSLGFFLFWALTALSSALTTWLIRTERRRNQFPTGRGDG